MFLHDYLLACEIYTVRTQTLKLKGLIKGTQGYILVHIYKCTNKVGNIWIIYTDPFYKGIILSC